MSKYNKNELYFFKFPNNFFESDEIEDILSEYDGDSIIVFYLKLILLSVNKMGYLCKIISGELIPYTSGELCKKTSASEEDFKRWIKRLFDVGLIEKKDNMLFIEDALKYTNQTIGAFKKQLQRKDEDICPPNCPPEIDNRNKNLDNRNKNLEIINNNSYSFEQLQQEETHPAWQDIICRVINYLNKKTDKHFKTNSKKATNNIKLWLSKGYTEEDLISVVDKMVNCWIGTGAEEYLRPETLFGPNFEGYLENNWTRIETNWQAKYLESI